jgi:tetratricopeptide (TPR) repeat protein
MLVAGWMSLAWDASAAECADWAAKVVTMQGHVETRGVEETRWGVARLDQTLCGGEMIRVAEHSRAVVLLRPDATTVQLDERSVMTIPKAVSRGPRWLELLEGAANFLSRTPNSLKITTPFLNAHIEGTEFLVRVRRDEASVLVFSGKVVAENSAGRLRLHGGQEAVAKASRAPVSVMVLRPRDAVEWALYYPPVIDYHSAALVSGPDGPVIRQALDRYRQGDARTALTLLDTITTERRDARYFNLRAALHLSVGRVAAARTDISQTLRRHPADATAIALRSVIALAGNQGQTALGLARRAVRLEPRSPVPRVALSYAQQAAFDIEAALASARHAIRLSRHNGLAWARLAELELSLGHQERARRAAERAVALDPKLARTHTVLGFVALARVRFRDAQSLFVKAIRLDSSDPLARLGWGLARIRQGALNEGTEAIEIATSLDPNRSLIRSYLGKAYYEQKRDTLARTEFDIAKELDPRDPTPWFYQAISEQTRNRPVAALRNLQRSIDLNDNRVVYRSRLLLDEDLATRNTSLGRLYTDLGFQQLAVVETSKSLSLDPANHTAHRLLSDSYLGLSRHEIAKGSELLQSRLLQPVTSNPVRPSRGASDIRIGGGMGLLSVGFNEFSPLFERNRARLLTSAFGGNHGTWGEEAVLSALYDRYALSLGQYHSESEGFRPNNDVEHNLYDLFAQVALTPSLDIQAEYRFQDREQGDRQLNFNPKKFFKDRRQAIDESSGRLGVHLKLSPQSDVLVSALYGDSTNQRLSFTDGNRSEFVEDQHGYQFDAQYLFKSENFNVIAGGNAYRIDIDRQLQVSFQGSVLQRSSSSSFRDHYSAYLYSHFNWPRNLFWTLGLSFDAYDEKDRESNHTVNPKLGLQWNITDSLYLRMAYMEILRRTPIVEQGLEPTAVAGFNQFFDDPAGTEAARYGVGLDARFSERLYAGVEFSRRDIRLPAVDTEDNGKLKNEILHEDLYRAYLYWTPSQHWSASVEYRLENFELEKLFDFRENRPLLRNTTTVPLTVRYFHPSGFFAGLGATYVQQDVELIPFESDLERGSDDFVTLDMVFGYRLPKRLGILNAGISNVLDEAFSFQDDSFRTGTLVPDAFKDQAADLGGVSHFFPDRTIFFGVTLSF